jgi:hypothetical protein
VFQHRHEVLAEVAAYPDAVLRVLYGEPLIEHLEPRAPIVRVQEQLPASKTGALRELVPSQDTSVFFSLSLRNHSRIVELIDWSLHCCWRPELWWAHTEVGCEVGSGPKLIDMRDDLVTRTCIKSIDESLG